MARGRFLSREIVLDKAIANLGSDTSRMLYMYAIPHLDVEGRVYGDPVVLAQLIGIRLEHITPDVVEICIAEWQEAELVEWYEADGDLWLEFTGFEKNQVGLRKDKEAPSRIPDPSTGQKHSVDSTVEVRSRSGEGRGNRREVRREEKLEEKVREEAPPDLPATVSDLNGTSLHRRIQKAFEEAFGSELPNYAKEGSHIKKIIKMADQRGDPEEVVATVLKTFQYLKEHGQDFWRRQPYLPSAVVSLWGRILSEHEALSSEQEDDVISDIVSGVYEK